jgi:hypothetical protein
MSEKVGRNQAIRDAQSRMSTALDVLEAALKKSVELASVGKFDLIALDALSAAATETGEASDALERAEFECRAHRGAQNSLVDG